MSAARIYLSPPHLSGDEREQVLDALDSGWIAPIGPHLDGFERDMCQRLGLDAAVALSSGTAALHLALEILGVGAGDTVWTSTLTFIASANAIRYVGATPVFVDSDRATWNMDAALLTAALDDAARAGNLPRALMIVDIYGQCADHDPIVAACRRHGVAVIEDAAEALGATYRERPAGTLGDIGVFSFNGNKIITTSGGGMLVSRRREWVDRARFLSTQAREPAPHYQHETMGYNYRMSNILAAIGRAQLAVLDQRVAARRRIRDAYRHRLGELAGIDFMPEAGYGRSNAWLTCVTVDPARFGVDREHIRLALEEKNIESRPVWKPMHLQPVFADAKCIGGDVAAELFETGLCLPSGSALTDDDLDRICAIIAQQAR